MAPTPAPQAEAIDDPVSSAGALEGRVLNVSTNRGVASAELTFSSGGAAASTITEQDGRFVFVPPSAGTWQLAAMTATGYLPYAPEWGHSAVGATLVAGKRVRGVTLFLTPAIDYRGRVVDPDGHPVAGAQVRLLDGSGEHALVPIDEALTSDASGEFVFHAPDWAVLEARHPDFAPGRAPLDTAAQISHRLVVRLGRKSGQAATAAVLSGRVLDPQGTATTGARVRAEPESAPGQERSPAAETTTDAAGRFELERLDQGRYSVSASLPGFAAATKNGVAAGTRDLVLKLERAARLRGTVRDATTGRPVPYFDIEVRPAGDAMRLVGSASVLDPEGRFFIDSLPGGRARVRAGAPGYADSAESEIDLEAGAEGRVDLVLDRGLRVAGTVLDRRSRAPLALARVTLEGRQGGPASARRTTVTDEGGRFELTGLTAGSRSLFVAATEHHARVVPLELAAGAAPPDLAIELTPTAPGEEPRIELVGIGVKLVLQGANLTVGQVFPGGGAEQAGLVAGDVLLAVDGRPVAELGFDGTIAAIRGAEGTNVTLTVRRADGSTAPFVAQRRPLRG